MWTCSSWARGSRASTSSTGRSKRAIRPCCSRPAGESGGPGTGTAIPGARFDSESYTYGYLFSQGPLRGLALGGALRPPARDRALPQPRRGPLRPAAAHPLRRPGQLGGVPGVHGHLAGAWPAGASTCGPASSSPPPVCSPSPTPPTSPGGRTLPARRCTPGRGRPRRSTSGASGWPSIGTSSSGVQVVPSIADQVESLTVYQRTANWCTPLNNRPISPEEQAQLRADFEQLRETLNTSVHGFHHRAHDRTAFEDPEEQAPGVLREDVEQPGLHQADEQLPGPAVEPRGQCRVVCLHRREDPRRRRGPGDGRAPRPARTTGSGRSVRRS